MLDHIYQDLNAYLRKYYLSQAIRGSLIWLGIALALGLAFVSLAYFLDLGTGVRTVFFYSYLAVTTGYLLYGVGWPLGQALALLPRLDYESAARQIGSHFPNIADKLVNTLQLGNAQGVDTALLSAAIAQRTAQISLVPFTKAVDFRVNARYLKYALPPLLLLLIIAGVVPQLLTEGGTKLIKHNQRFAPKAPFQFDFAGDNLKAYAGEDFPIAVNVRGKALPAEVYVVVAGRRLLMTAGEKPGTFSHTIRNVQQETAFHFEAAGFASDDFTLAVGHRPSLNGFQVAVRYPAYLNRPAENLGNVGNFTVPAGTLATWSFNAAHTDSLWLGFNPGPRRLNAQGNAGKFQAQQRLLKSGTYTVNLRNPEANNSEPISYQIEVIPDQYPTINLEAFKDSSLFTYVVLGGNLGDDYGISKLEMSYTITRKDQKPINRKQRIKLASNQPSQAFYVNWGVDSLNLQAGDQLSYFLTVYDNDGVSGPKATQSAIRTMAVPDKGKLEADLAKQSSDTEAGMQSSVKEAKKLNKDLEKLKDRIRTKRELTWADKKLLEDLAKKKQDLESQVAKLQEQYDQLKQKQQRFEQPNPEIAKKMEQLKELMDNLLDDETKKLYNRLQDLLKEQEVNPDLVQQMLEKMEKKEENLTKELDRSLALFKQLQLDQKLEKGIEKLESLAKEQQELAQKVEDLKKGNQAAKPEDLKKLEDLKKQLRSEVDKDKAAEAMKAEGKQDPGKDDKTAPDAPKSGEKSKDQPQTGDKQQPPTKGDDKSPQGKQQSGKPQQPNTQKQALQEQQNALKQQLNEVQEDIKSMQELAEELQEKMDDLDQPSQDAEREMEEAEQNLEKDQNKKAAEEQKKAAEKMQELAQKMKGRKAEQAQQDAAENEEDLRKVLDNLLTLSFEQEELMKNMRGINQSDPRYVPLGQQQLRLTDNAKVIEDSLTALAKRVFSIRSFVTKEMNEMKEEMDLASEAIKTRRVDQAQIRQQMAMTHMNNLALMLSESLKNMQEENESMGAQGSGGKKKKKKKKPGKPKGGNLSQMQQELNKQIQALQKGMQKGDKDGKGSEGGRQLSEQLAKAAAQQAALRRALREMESKMNGNMGGGKQGSQGQGGNQQNKQGQPGGKDGKGTEGMSGLAEKMEQTERELVNKRITQETVLRQREIMTRLLEAENAMRERDEDPKRESNTGKDIPRAVPPNFDKYIKERQQQVELLRTVPPDMTPFYKQEALRYLNTIGSNKQ